MTEIKEYVAQIIEQARESQKAFEKCSQKEVDKIVKSIGQIVYDKAEPLAKMAVDETAMGVYEDKITKNKAKSRNIWHSLKDKKSIGIINKDLEKQLVYIAKPVGVVGAVTPCTNPIVTPMCNAMFALKGGNAIIIAPHPRGLKSGQYLVGLFQEELEKQNLPKNLIQITSEASIDITNQLMQEVDVIVATGGMGMVKAAYSSGRPSFGVGAGNVQCIFDRDIDLAEATKKVVLGAQFDNGIICSSEQSIIAHKNDYAKVVTELKANNVYYAEDEVIVDKFRKVLFDEKGTINKDIVGQSPSQIGELAGVQVDSSVRVIALKAKGVAEADILCKEKLCPAIITLEYETFEQALEIAQKNLDFEGKGHSAAIHSNNQEHIERAGLSLTVSRLVVNQSASLSAGGALNNGFAATTTLGCGSWGNNSISENLDYKHLINVSRIGLPISEAKIPSDQEIWEGELVAK